MSTAILSDMHLGAANGSDLLRRPAALHALLEAVTGMDELVLLGDVVELRKLPVARALDAARGPLSALGRVFEGRRVTIVPGNHDHALASSLLESIRLRGDGAELGLETTAPPPPTGLLAAVADMLAPAEVRLAYPGVWVRPDVYATHGHYLDVHHTVPSVERIAIGAMRRYVGGLPQGPLTPWDYEAIVTPVYRITYELAQSNQSNRSGDGAKGSDASVRVWQAARGTGVRKLPALLLGGVAVPTAVAGLNRAGMGPFKADLSGAELRRAALVAMRAVVERLGIEADHVIFGHTHRHGPRPSDKTGWKLPSGTQLMNTGSWVVEPAFLEGRRKSPYWPGHCAVVPDEGPPELLDLLPDLPAPE
jgi:predicted phosphodiesterase